MGWNLFLLCLVVSASLAQESFPEKSVPRPQGESTYFTDLKFLTQVKTILGNLITIAARKRAMTIDIVSKLRAGGRPVPVPEMYDDEKLDEQEEREVKFLIKELYAFLSELRIEARFELQMAQKLKESA